MAAIPRGVHPMKLLILLILFLDLAMAKGATINAASASLSDVASAISSAQNGDTVKLPAGQNATWSSALTISGKGITVDFNGCTINRNISSNEQMIKVTTVASVPTRLTGGTFTGGSSGSGYNGRYMVISPAAGPFRLDHCTFETAGGVFLDINQGPGLIDHCVFNASSVQEIIHCLGYGYNSTAGWANDVTPGGQDATYIEDCTFNKNFGGNAGALHACASFYGHRTVFRHNTVNGGMDFDAHGTAGNIGTRWYECYDNDWYVNCNLDKVFQLRAGSGVIFNNVLHNQSGAAGGRTITLWEEDPGPYPALYQIGRGKNQSLDPLYIWGNTAVDAGGGTGGMQIGNVSSNLIQQGRDFYVSQKPNYTPYPYPHPLQSGGGGPTPSPTASVSPTASPSPSGTPSPTPPSSKFAIGDWVAPSPNTANVRDSAAGNLLGTQVVGTVGQVTAGPVWGQLSGSASGVFWWNVVFQAAPSGWIGEDNLIAGTAPSPTPSPPQPTPSPSISPSPSVSPTPPVQTWENWILELNDWIRKNPPVPDQPLDKSQRHVPHWRHDS